MKTLFWRILALIVFLQPYQVLKASWSTPVVIPLDLIAGNAKTSYFDSAENLIFLYQDASVNNALTAVRILPTGVAAPSVVISPSLDTKEISMLAVSPSGDYLVAVWANSLTNQIQASVYTTATATWSPFQNIGVFSFLNEMVVSIDSSKRATVGWLSGISGSFTIYSSTLASPLTGFWSTPIAYNILDPNPQFVKIDASGHFLAASWEHVILGNNYYHFIQIDQSAGVPAWSSIDDVNIGTNSINKTLLKEDSLGNIVSVWTDALDNVKAWNSTTIGSFATLYSSTSVDRFYLEVDNAGKASLLFITPSPSPAMTNEAQSSTLFFSSGNWSPIAVLATPFIVIGPEESPLNADAIGPGHANFTWAQGNSATPTTGIINFAVLTNPPNASSPGTWSTPIILSNPLEVSFSSSIVGNANGDLLVAWAHFEDMIPFVKVSKKLVDSAVWSAPVDVEPTTEGAGLALSNKGKGGIFSFSELQDVSLQGVLLSVELNTIPTPPINLIGVIKKNVFLTQKDRIHFLSWTASTDPAVVFYQVYRNGKLIAVIPATDPLVYADHNRNKRILDTYTVVAVTASGNISKPAWIILQ